MISFGRKQAKLKIEPWSDDYRAPVVGPFGLMQAIERQSFLKAMMTAAIITVLVLNIFLALAVISQMTAQPYVADGSRFGCLVQPLQTE